eukprot:gene12463-59206_t
MTTTLELKQSYWKRADAHYVDMKIRSAGGVDYGECRCGKGCNRECGSCPPPPTVPPVETKCDQSGRNWASSECCDGLRQQCQPSVDTETFNNCVEDNCEMAWTGSPATS